MGMSVWSIVDSCGLIRTSNWQPLYILVNQNNIFYLAKVCILNLSGDIYEHAVILSVKTEDQDAFERDFFQLKPYYTDAG